MTNNYNSNGRSSQPKASFGGWLRMSALVAIFASLSLSSSAQVVSVTATAGTAGPTLYATVKLAFDAINAGTHQGAIVISINANTSETAPAVLNSTGAGSASYTSVLVQPTADGLTISGATATGRGLIELNGADNVTINGDNPNTGGTNRNLTITNTAANTVTHTSCVRIAVAATVVTSANGNTISNLIVNGSATGLNASGTTSTTGVVNASYGIYAGGGASIVAATTAPSAITSVSTTVGTGATYNNLVISNNAVNACARAIYVGGSAAAVCSSLTISNNTIGAATPNSTTTVYSMGITAQGTASGLISGNTIRSVESWLATSIRGIDVGSISSVAGDVFTVSGNTVSNVVHRATTSVASYGAYGINIVGGTGNTISNNFIYGLNNCGSGLSTTYGCFGIRIGANTNHKVYHNSVNLSGTNLTALAAYQTACLAIVGTGQTGVDVRNNIFSNTSSANGQASSYATCIYLPTAGTSAMNLTLNNNVYYTGSTSGLHGVLSSGTTYVAPFTVANFNPALTTPATNSRSYTSTLSAAGTNDNASYASTSAAPFTSNTNLLLNTSSSETINNLWNKGATGTGVTTDIQGEARPLGVATNPTIGADEVLINVCVAADGGTITPSTANGCVGATYTMSTTGSTSGAGITYQWEVSSTGGGVGFSNVVGGSGATTNSYTTAALTAGTNYYRLKVFCSNGSITGYSNELALTTFAVPTASASSNSPICAGQNLNLTSTTDIGTSFSWTGPGGYTSSTQNPIISSITTAGSGTYLVVVSTLAGCSASASASVTVNASPTGVTASATPLTVCSGSPINLSSSYSSSGVTGLNNYSATRTTGTSFTSILPATQVTSWRNLVSTDDNLSDNQPIGFNFIYNGITYTTFRISTNGFLTLDNTSTATGSGTGAYGYSNSWPFTPGGLMIAPNWDDLQTAGNLGTITDLNNSINYTTSGSAPSRIFTAEWNNMQDYSTTSTASYNFQVKFYEADNHIEFVYGTMTQTGLPSYSLGLSAATVSLTPLAAQLLSQTTVNTGTFGFTNQNSLATVPASNTMITFVAPAGTISWSGPSSFSSAIANPTVASATTSGSYTVTITNPSNGCTLSASAAVVVPTIAVSGGATNPSCNGGTNGSVTFSATGGVAPYTYTLNGNAATSPTSGLAAGSYVVLATDANGCTGTTTLTITQPTVVTVSGSGTNPTCYNYTNGSVTFSASGGTPGYTYTLNGSPATSPATGLAPGTFVVIATDANGCTGTNSFTITAPAAPSVTASNDGPVCEGGTINLNSSNGFASYAWSGPASYSASGQAQALAAGTPSMNGSYSVLATDANGCTATGSTSVTFNATPAAPTVTASAATICAPGTITFTSSYAGAGNVWSPGGATTDAITASAAGSYSYTVVYTDANGCSAASVSAATGTIYPANAVSITPASGSFCGSKVLTSSVVGNNVWSTTAVTDAITVTSSATYSVVNTDANGCSASASAVITVNPIPAAPTVTASAATICAPGTITFTSSYAGAGNVWSPGGATTASVIASGAGSYSYTVVYTDPNGCTSAASAAATGTIYPANAVSITPATTSFCAGGSATLTSSVTGGNVWSTTATTDAITVTSSATYSVVNTNANGCTASASATTTIKALPTAAPTASCTQLFPGRTSVLTANATAGSGTISTYSWLLNGVPIVPAATAATYTTLANANGNYTVTVTNSNGCSFTSAPLAISNLTGPLAGTFTIGAACGFTSINTAATYINTNGVGGNVVLNVPAGYTETAPAGGISINMCALALGLKSNASQTITIQKSGAGANPIITAGVGAGTVDAIVKLVGADYVTIDGINVTDPATNITATTRAEWGYALLKCDGNDGANSNTIKNCVVTLQKIYTASIGIYSGNHNAAVTTALVYSGTAGDATQADLSRNGRNTFTGNTITNVYGAFSLNGNASSTGSISLNDTLNAIGVIGQTANTITNFGGSTIAVVVINETNQRGMSVDNNSINGGTGSTLTVTGINMTSGSWGKIRNNSLALTTTATTSAIVGITCGFSGGIDANPNIIIITGNTVALTSTTITTALATGITCSTGGASPQITISNNSVNGCSLTSTTGGFTGITQSNTANNTTIIINNNQVNSNSLAGTGQFLGISAAGAPTNTALLTPLSSLSFSNNTVSNNTKTSTGNMFCVYSGHTSPTLLMTQNSNTVNQNTIAGGALACTLVGITAGAANFTMNGNTVTNLAVTAVNTTAVGNVLAIQSSGATTTNSAITNNTVSGITMGGNSTGASLVRGILATTSASDIRTISGNKISNVSTSFTTSATCIGIISVTGLTSNIFNNKIFDFVPGQNGTVFSGAKGIVVAGATTSNVYNNVIGFDYSSPVIPVLTSLNAVVGLEVSGGTNANLYFNTIRLAGSGSGTAFGSSGINLTVTTANVDMRNNIVNNLMSPGTAAATNSSVALRRSAAALTGYATTSDRNIWYSGTPGVNRLIYFDGTNSDQTLAAFQTRVATREANSFTEAETFQSVAGANASFLKLSLATPTFAESNARPAGSITTDYFATVRNVSTPDIGAHEDGFTPNGIVITNPTITPGVSCTASAHNITADVSGSPTSVTLNFAFNGVAQTPVAMVLGSGINYSGSIPVATPTNAVVTYTINATNGVVSAAYAGTSYQDEYLNSAVLVATTNLSTICSGASITASASGPVPAAPATYTNATYSTGSGAGDYLINVTLGSINNTTANSAAPFNTYYSALNTNLTAGIPATLSGTISNGGTETAAAWIDYNHNGVFESSEKIGEHTSLSYSIVFTVPLTAYNGVTRMRVRAVYSSTGLDPYLSYTYGEAEDYNVTIAGGSSVGGLATGYTSYSWSNGVSVVGTGNPSTFATSGSGAVTYTVTATDANGCTKQATATPVTVIALPATPVATNSAQCGIQVPTASVTGSGTPGNTFKWYLVPTGGTALAGQTGSTLAAYSISATTTFYVTEFNGTCESARVPVVVTVSSPTPIVATSSVVLNTCPFVNFNLGVTSANDPNYVYTWAIGAVGSGITAPLTGASQTIQATAGGTFTYTVNAFDAISLCSATNTVIVTVSNPPAIDNITTTAATVCSGSPTTISVYSAGISSGPQVNPTGYCVSGTSVNFADEQIFGVTFGSMSNIQSETCTTNYSNYTTTIASPTVTAGQTVPFSVISNECDGATFYSSGLSIFIDYNRDGDFVDAGETAYTTLVTTTQPSTRTGNIVIPANAPAGLTRMRVVIAESIASPLPCDVYTYTETEDYAVNILGVVAQDPLKTYVWSPGGETTPTISVSPISTTTYTVAVTASGNTCTNYASKTITTNPIPTAPTANDNSQCGPGTPTCSVTNSGAGTNRWYLAPTGGTALVGQTGTTLTAYSISTTTTFYVSLVNNGCESARTAVVQTVNTPETITLTSTTPACIGSSITLTASNPAYAFNSYTLTATPAVGSGIPSPLTGVYTGAGSSQSFTITPLTAGTYVYSILATDGACSGAGSVTVVVGNVPTITSATASPTTVCSGSPVTLTGLTGSTSTATVTVGTGTTPNPSSSSLGAFYPTWYGNARQQWLITASELTALGLTAGNITAMKINLGAGVGTPATLNGYTLKLASTAAAAITTWQAGTFTTVFGPVNYTPTPSALNTHTFSTPFFWNGTSNILVDMCFASGVSGSASYVNNNTTTSFSSMVYYQADGVVADPCGTAILTGSSTTRPNIILVGTQSTAGAGAYAWQWGPGVIPSGNVATVNPTVTGLNTYSVIATDVPSGCTATASASVTVLALPATPVATVSTQCGFGIPTASVTGAAGNLRWYLAATGGTALAGETGNTLTTYSINATTTFYVSESDGTCESARVPVLVTVTQPDAVAATASVVSGCTLNAFNLIATQTGSTNVYTYSWSSSAGSGIVGTLAGTPAPVTPTLAGTYTYTVVATDAGASCATASSVTITVGQSPVIAVTPLTSSVCPNVPVQLNTNQLNGAGSAISLNGSTQYLTIPSSSGLNYNTAAGSSFTLEAWTKANTGVFDAGIISRYPVSPAVGYFLRQGSVSPYTGIGAGGNSEVLSTPSTGVVTFGTWAHVAAVFTNNPPGLNTTVQIYVNGVLKATGVTVMPTSSNPITIGLDYGSRFFNGQIDEVRIWSAALSQATISTWSAKAVDATHPNYASLQAYYNFNVASGSTIADLSGNGNTATIVGGAALATSTIPLSSASFAWSPTSGLSNPAIGNPIATTSSTTTYTVTATNPNGCTVTGTSVITILPTAPAPTATNSTQCGNGVPTASVTGTGAPGNTFKWYLVPTAGTALVGQTGSTLTAYAISTTTTFYVAEFNGTCEGPRSPVVVTVNQPDAINVTANSSSICLNTGVTLTANQTGSTNTYAFTWNGTPVLGNGITVPPTGSPVTITPTAAGTYVYTVTATDATLGCVTTGSISITVNPLPLISSATANPTQICPGGSSVLTGLTGSSSTGTGTIGTGTTVEITGSDGNPLRSGNGTGNQIRSQMIVTASELSALGFVAGPISSLAFINGVTASGGTITNVEIKMGHTALSAYASTTYETTAMTSVYTNPSITFSGTVLPTFTFSTPFMWNGTSNIIINTCQTNSILSTSYIVATTPVFNSQIYTANSTTSCSNLTAAVSMATRPKMILGGTFSSAGPGTYAWQWGPGVIPSGNVATVSPTTPGANVYTVTATNPISGCTATATATVTVINTATLPTVSTTPSSICFSGTTALAVTNPVVGVTYSWEAGPTASGPWVGIGTGVTLTTGTISVDTYFQVTATCGASSSTSVPSLVSVANPTITSVVGATRCGLGTVNLSVVGTGSFDWFAGSTGGTALVTNTSTYSPIVASNTTFWVEAYIGTCISAAGRVPVAATVNTSPAVVVVASPSATICSGNSVTLTASSPNDPNYSYSWSLNGITPVATGSTYSVSPTSTTTYFVLGADNTAGPFATCQATASQIIVVNASPVIAPTSNITQICNSGASVTLSANASGAPAAVLLDATFNAGDNGFVSTQTSTAPGLTFANVATSTYSAGANLGGANFFEANADIGGSGSSTQSILTSAAINTAAYGSTPLMLTWDQAYFYYSAGSDAVRAEVWNGTAWVTVYTAPAASDGLYGSPVSKSVNIAAYANAALKVRFVYNSNWGFYYAVDNVKIASTASSVPALSWSASPADPTLVGQTTSANPVVIPTVGVTYTVVATNPNGCTTSGTVTINSIPAPTPVLNYTGDQSLCSSDPELVFSVSDAVNGAYSASTYLVDWTPGITNQNPSLAITQSVLGSPVQARVHTLDNGCSALSNIVNVTTVSVGLSVTTVSASCAGADGSITATATGVGPFTFQYYDNAHSLIHTVSNSVSNVNTYSGLGSDVYYVTATGNSNLSNITIPSCTSAQQTATVGGTVAFALSTTTTSETCPGANNGSATALPTGGSGSFSYDWQKRVGHAYTQTIGPIAPGIYGLTVTDNVSLCSTTILVTINAAIPATYTLTNTPATCYGATDGSLNADFTGSAVPILGYEWLDGPGGNVLGTDAPFTGAAGSYYLHYIEDNANQCEITVGPIVIGQPAQIVISSFTPTSSLAGATVTITGSGFDITSAVRFNGLVAVTTFVSSTQLTAVVPVVVATSTGYITVTNGLCSGTSTTTFTTNVPTFTTFNLKVFIEGYYIGGGTMNAALYNQGVSVDPTETDTITVQLEDPLNIGTPVETVQAILHTDGTAQAIFSAAASSQPYFVTIKHRHALQTYSAAAMNVSNTPLTPYDFTTGATQAAGNNQQDNSIAYPGDLTFSMYAGDVNQDGFIAGDDVTTVDTDNIAGVFGVYVATDITGDGYVSGDDVTIVDTNNVNGVFIQTP